MGREGLLFAAYALGGYLLGGIFFSSILAKVICGVDIEACSRDGNPGTANAMQYAGVRTGFLCLVCDLAKGFVPVFLGAHQLPVAQLAFGFVLAAPVAGHAFSAYRRLHGGKAIAVSFGVLLGLLPAHGLVWILAGVYIFFSIIIRLNPHERRTVWTFFFYFLFALVLYWRGNLPLSLLLGSGFIVAMVIYRNLDYRRQSALDRRASRKRAGL